MPSRARTRSPTSAGEHGGLEQRVGEGGDRLRRAELAVEVQPAPVRDRALHHEGDERQHADEVHHERQPRTALAAGGGRGVGDVGAAEDDRQGEGEDRAADERLGERQSGRGAEGADQPAGDAARAPPGVHAVHDGPFVGPFHGAGLGVHADVGEPEGHPEQRDRDEQQCLGGRQPDQGQADRRQRRGDLQDRGAAQSCHDASQPLHRDDGTDPPDQDGNADIALPHPELVREGRRP
ncbi:hypothetical protein [Actinoallomurus acanthiterrae]